MVIMLSNRYISGGFEYFYSVGQAAFSPLTVVAQAVMEKEPAQHFFQGFRQFFSGPFWNKAEQKKFGLLNSSLTAINKTLAYWMDGKNTRSVLNESLQRNVLEYILPIILYRRAVRVLSEHYVPDEYENLLAVADAAVMMTIVSRLFLRRTFDNVTYSMSLPRAVSNDVANHLPKVVSKEISAHLAHMFRLIFAHANPDCEKGLQKILEQELFAGYQKFFANGNINDKTFEQIKNPLQQILIGAICQYFKQDASP